MYSEVMTISQASWTSGFHGNFRWLAPELLGESDNDLPIRPSKHSDVYSFGGIMLQVCREEFLGSAVKSLFLPLGPHQQNSVLLHWWSSRHSTYRQWGQAFSVTLSCGLWQVLAFYWRVLGKSNSRPSVDGENYRSDHGWAWLAVPF
jgi:hypothetical protein